MEMHAAADINAAVGPVLEVTERLRATGGPRSWPGWPRVVQLSLTAVPEALTISMLFPTVS